MKDTEVTALKQKIRDARLISFDVFDTLVFRKTNDPETIFDLVGKHFGIHGFRKLRMDEQNEASRRAFAKRHAPHADMNEIYEVLKEHVEYPVDFEEVKAYEIQMEKDALVANEEMLEIFRYAKSLGKRVIATSDMYLLAETLQEILVANGYEGLDHVYCSADEGKAKFNKELFELVAQKEQVPYEEILHVGDKQRDDVDYPSSFGMQTFLYERDAELDKVKDTAVSEIDNGLYKILHDKNKSFWYNLGVEAGGPLYVGLYLWLVDRLKKEKEEGKKIFFLSRDGYNLCKLFQDNGYENVTYLHASRRSLMLACVTEMNEEDVRELPPFTKGQTVGGLLKYLCIDKDRILHLQDAGFHDFDDVIASDEDMQRFKKLYFLDRDVFLERCAIERENAVAYFQKIGFLDDDAIIFDCGWSGSSQALIERFKKSIGCDKKTKFYYFGIRNSERSRMQLHGKHYETYAFDFYRNYYLQWGVSEYTVVMYELFFSAPHESVYYYDKDGVVFEDGNGDDEKREILEGIRAYLKEALPFATKYPVEYAPELALGHLQRLIERPTQEEAVLIGNMKNVDGFARQEGAEKYVAYVTKEQFEQNPYVEIYWMKGLLAREDVPEDLKIRIAQMRGFAYPAPAPMKYNLEDEQSIRNYHRWLRVQEQKSEPKTELAYRPKFSIVMPVYNTVTEQLREAIESVLAQTYDDYELILVDDHSTWDSVVPVLKSYESDPHVKLVCREVNGHISVATNDGLSRATGEFAVFMDCDDVIDPDALYYFAKKLNENRELDFIYSDEDKITEDGKIRHMPHFKPEWSPALFWSMMYTNHLAIYRLSIIREIGGLRTAYNGSQDYDMTLRFMEKSSNKRVGHVPRILYHWRERKESVALTMSSKNYAVEASRYAKEDALRRRGIAGHMEATGLRQYRTVFDPVGEPLVSIVIPSKDHYEILKQCIDSIREFTDYKNYEIIVVDNGSSGRSKEKIAEYLQKVNATYLYETATFNFSKMCNAGANAAKGSYVLFLNDDVEIFQPDWLARMVGQAIQPEIGAVGAKLFYPNSTTLQHGGIANVKGGPLHNYQFLADDVPYGMGYNWVEYNCIGVTGACLLVSMDAFRKVGGFDETFPIAYNDVDFCFKLDEAGYYNVMRNDVAAYHHESLSRGTDMLDEAKLIRLSGELQRLYQKHPARKGYDPYLSIHLKGYQPVLDPSERFDVVTPARVRPSGCDIRGSVDIVEVTDSIRIIGWSLIFNRTDNTELKRNLILVDPYGQQYRISCENLSRTDLVAAFPDREDFLYCGFECRIDRSVVRMDLMPFKTGVEIIEPDGTSRVLWTPLETKVVRYSPTGVTLYDYEKADPETYENGKAIRGNIDLLREDGNDWLIKGWAYLDDEKHFSYRKKLFLRSVNGKDCLLQNVIEEERIDIAIGFPELHYLYKTGFSCHVYKGDLLPGEEYDVIVRMVNHFDPADVCDFVTGRRIRG